MTEVRNSIGGKVELVSRDGFFKLFDPETHEVIETMLKEPEVKGMVCFEVLDMSSSQLGHRRGLIFGDNCTYKTLETVCQGRLGDVPSRFAYPVKAYVKEVS